LKRTLPKVAQEVLKILKKDRTRFYSTRELSTYFDVSPYGIHQAANELRDWGYVIEEGKGKSYRLKDLPDVLLPHDISENLHTRVVGKEIHAYKALKSTNELAYRLAREDAPEGTLVISDHQTKGKGRMGRGWLSPPKVGLWLSLVLRPPIPPARAPAISVCTGLALASSVREMTQLDARIKWPNDCVIQGKKVAGVLLELSAELDKIDFVILGVGINVNQDKQAFPKSLVKKATSLKMELGEEVDRLKLLKLFLENFEKVYSEFLQNGLERLRRDINGLSSLLGKEIKVRFGKKTLKGEAKDINEDGGLIIRTKQGEKVISAGEVALL